MHETPDTSSRRFGKVAQYVGCREFAAAMIEVRHLRLHRRNADFVATFPVLNRKTLCQNLRTRQTWRIDDL
ncbi:hypothetical protein PPGU19_068760 (plasmid) [Paraburkholderia sp. PGU19]|nr:hypothetical protein PPGU19_068760 [Paraburkholderia sp. PGU19]